MPWHVDKTESCPVSKPWGVIKDADGKVVGCHESKTSALRQLGILNQIEKSSRPYLEKLWKDEMQAVILAAETSFETIQVKLNPSEFKYSLWIADTAQRRKVGLSFRSELPSGVDGIIFMYVDEDVRTISPERAMMNLILYSFNSEGELQDMGSLKSGTMVSTVFKNSQFIVQTTKEDIDVQFLEFLGDDISHENKN